jgi:hypothetical protein
VRIGAGQIDDQPGSEAMIELRKRGLQRMQVLGVAAAIGQFDIQVAGFLAKGEVPRAVQRQREDRVIAAKDTSGAVALMHVQIHDRDLQRCTHGSAALRLQQARCNRSVVEDAKAAALVRRRVVRAAGNVGGDTFAQRRAAGCDGRADRSARAFDHRGAPWKPDLAHGLRIDGTIADGAHVGWAVNQGQFAIGGRVGPHELNAAHLMGQALAQQLVLGHGKPVTRRQRQHEFRGIEDLHERHCRGLRFAAF